MVRTLEKNYFLMCTKLGYLRYSVAELLIFLLRQYAKNTQIFYLSFHTNFRLTAHEKFIALELFLYHISREQEEGAY